MVRRARVGVLPWYEFYHGTIVYRHRRLIISKFEGGIAQYCMRHLPSAQLAAKRIEEYLNRLENYLSMKDEKRMYSDGRQ